MENQIEDLNTIIYDLYGNICPKDYKKIENIFKKAESNKELYNHLKCYTKCYCNKIVRKNHMKHHLLSNQHKRDAREILPNYLLFNYNSMNPHYLNRRNNKCTIDNCKTILSFD